MVHLRSRRPARSNQFIFNKNINGLNLKINKIFGGPHVMLVHFRYLKLKTNKMNKFD
jgi:hypothetical protein